MVSLFRCLVENGKEVCLQKGNQQLRGIQREQKYSVFVNKYEDMWSSGCCHLNLYAGSSDEVAQSIFRGLVTSTHQGCAPFNIRASIKSTVTVIIEEALCDLPNLNS